MKRLFLEGATSRKQPHANAPRACPLSTATLKNWLQQKHKAPQRECPILNLLWPLGLTVEQRARRLVIRLAPDPERSLALNPPTLSQREAEVLHWVAEGKTDGEVGTILGLSSRTVQKHLEKIYQKLGVENRTAAAARAHETAAITSK